ncbi:hypothetical protein AXX17_AT3G32660 [Arabidopsis thaliana]|uniref:Uncharacterized protein n=1 Tax=Arabidopsis thaliana TaxID=3702 RepID=A0A178VNI4_ARATH|nr:hypothetical protein AXX17_AT3G32660 [Arabidopsis thaliana]
MQKRKDRSQPLLKTERNLLVLKEKQTSHQSNIFRAYRSLRRRIGITKRSKAIRDFQVSLVT